MAAGRCEDSFWRQTPASYTATIRADYHRQQAAIERDVAVQYIAAQMAPPASVGQLPPLEDFLRVLRPRRKRCVADWIQTFKDAAARMPEGTMTITEREGQGDGDQDRFAAD